MDEKEIHRVPRAPDKRRVLIVDDDVDFAEGLADILDLQGYGFSIAHDASGAMEKTRDFDPHVALVDIRLKDVNGIELIGELKREYPGLISIIITAFAAVETAINAIQQGAYDYLRKPIEGRDLLATLDRCFERLRLQKEKEFAEEALKKRNQALEKEKERFRILVDEAPLGIAILSNDGVYQYINPRFIELFGYSQSDIPTYHDWCLRAYPDPDYRNKVMEISGKNSKAATKGQPITRTLNIRCGDGSEKVVFARSITMKTGDRFIMYEDVTQRMNLEAQIQQAQKMEAVGTLAGGIAHDFNNLLQGIQGYSQLLLIEKSKNDPEYAKLKEIERAAERASELTQQLLTFSRKVESKLRPLDMNQVLKQAHRLLQRTIPKMIHMELLLEKDLKIVNADPVQMEQVLMNMAINSRDAMPDGGEILFKTANVRFDEDYCQTHLGIQPGDYVEITISDTGQGLTPESMDHIFEPFYTTKGVGKGTGLGLSMVYGIIKSHGGDISCASIPGEGTVFKIHLPVIGNVSEFENGQAEEDLPRGGAETVLLIEDEAFLRDLGTDILTKFGYFVITCSNGESGLEIYREKGDRIALIILDLIMPGMGGKRCMEEILKIHPGAKIIIASGYVGDETTKTSLEPFVKGFIKKPYDVRQMLQVIRETLDGAP